MVRPLPAPVCDSTFYDGTRPRYVCVSVTTPPPPLSVTSNTLRHDSQLLYCTVRYASLSVVVVYRTVCNIYLYRSRASTVAFPHTTVQSITLPYLNSSSRRRKHHRVSFKFLGGYNQGLTVMTVIRIQYVYSCSPSRVREPFLQLHVTHSSNCPRLELIVNKLVVLALEEGGRSALIIEARQVPCSDDHISYYNTCTDSCQY